MIVIPFYPSPTVGRRLAQGVLWEVTRGEDGGGDEDDGDNNANIGFFVFNFFVLFKVFLFFFFLSKSGIISKALVIFILVLSSP